MSKYPMLADIDEARVDAVGGKAGVIKKDVEFIKNILSEDFELSDEAKKQLKEARATDESECIELE